MHPGSMVQIQPMMVVKRKTRCKSKLSGGAHYYYIGVFMNGFIYKISNTINDKVYIGQTSGSVEDRFKEHLNMSYYNDSAPLYRAIKRHGRENFYIEIVEECLIDNLNEREVYWIKFFEGYSRGYNASLGGSGRQIFDYDEIWSDIIKGATLQELQNKFSCGKDTIYTVVNLHNYVLSPNTTKKIEKPVYQFTKDNKYIQTFINPKEAMRWCQRHGYSSCEENQITQFSTHIRAVCRGTRKSAYGFKWSYTDTLK